MSTVVERPLALCDDATAPAPALYVVWFDAGCRPGPLRRVALTEGSCGWWYRLRRWPRHQESNLDLRLRRASFYPLNHSERAGL